LSVDWDDEDDEEDEFNEEDAYDLLKQRMREIVKYCGYKLLGRWG
jgi:hypothetical protein